MTPSLGAPRLATFMFHEVTDDPASSGFQRPGAIPYKHSLAAFADYLDRLSRSPAAPPVLVGDTDLTRPGHHLLLTFDDGGASALAASELLLARGWRGHFFIVTSLIGRQGFLDAAGIRALHQAGHEVGSHSHTHPGIFRALTRERLLEEWGTSRTILSELLGKPCDTASVPGGDSSASVFTSAAEAGYRYLFTSEPWVAPQRTGSCWLLGRYSVKVTTTAARLEELASFRGWTGALVRRRMKVWATQALPPLYRWYVKVRTSPEG